MKLPAIVGRRPSASIVISSAALFMSLGGVGYAATSLPSNSVGSSQLRSNAVTYQKIAPEAVGKVRLANGGVINSKLARDSVAYYNIQNGAVGKVRANLSQLQARVDKTCGAGTAIGAISETGTPTCNSTATAEYGAADVKTALTSGTASTVASKLLPAGSDYLAFADNQVAVTSGSAVQRVAVSCTLTVGTTTQTRSVVVPTDGTTGDVAYASLPLQVAGAAGTASVSCTPTIPAGATGTSVAATSGLNAIQTSSDN